MTTLQNDVNDDVDDVRNTVSLACRVLAGNGASDMIWGHASQRDSAGRGVWLKAAGWGLEEIARDRVHLVGWDGAIITGGGQRHVEYPIHTTIMAARPEVGGVVHVHSPFSVALAAAGQDLRPVSHAANYFSPLGVPRFEESSDLILTDAMGQAVCSALGNSAAVFLANHGIVTVGRNVQEATFAAIMLETASKQQLLTMGFGTGATWTDADESIAKRQHIYSQTSIAAAWEYLVRSLT